MDRSHSVCVVGSGQTGILTAAKLRELGYQHIDILEARDQIGGLSETAVADGKVYDFQAHLIIQQDFGADMAGTAINELISRHPVELQTEALYFVSRADDGSPAINIPPHFIPLLSTLTPMQAVDQLAEAWTIIETAVRKKKGPGLAGLNFDGIPGETWESWKARHAPLVGEILQGISLYANMRRPRQPAESIININAHISGHVSQLAKLLLAMFPADKEAMLQRMPATLVAQIGSRRPITLSFPHGFISFLRRIVEDHQLEIKTGHRVVRITPSADGVEVTSRTAAGEITQTYSRVVVTARPAQIREIFPSGPLHELFSEKHCPRTWTRSYLIRAGQELIDFPSSKPIEQRLGFWVIDPYGSYTDTDPEQAYHRITAANKQHAGPYWVCFANSDRSVSDAEAWELARESLFLFKDPELVEETIAEWPVCPSAAAIRAGWFGQVDRVQGQGGVYFAGEVLSGPTVECISTYVRDVIPVWFG